MSCLALMLNLRAWRVVAKRESRSTES